jgi:hypothetical protein
MVVTLMFAWHIAAVLTVMIFIGASIYVTCYRRVAMSSHWNDDEPEPSSSYKDEVQLLSVKAPPSAAPANSNHLTLEDEEFDSDSESHFINQPQ